MGIPMLKIFNMGIPILVRRHLLYWDSPHYGFSRSFKTGLTHLCQGDIPTHVNWNFEPSHMDDRIFSANYHGCWLPGFFYRQAISNYVIKYSNSVDHYLPWQGRISIIWHLYLHDRDVEKWYKSTDAILRFMFKNMQHLWRSVLVPAGSMGC